MRLDPLFALMEDWADGKVMLEFLERLVDGDDPEASAGGLVTLLYKLLSRRGAGGSEKGSRRAVPVR